MQLTSNEKINFALLFLFVAIFTCKQLQPKEKVDELVIDGIHMRRQPCKEAMDEMFGRGVDTSKVCDCLFSNFYSFVKNDSALLQRFLVEQMVFTPEGHWREDYLLLYAACIRSNIVDSNYVLHLKPDMKAKFTGKFSKDFKAQGIPHGYNPDSLAACLVDKLDGGITIGEYFADDYSKLPRMQEMLLKCLADSAKK